MVQNFVVLGPKVTFETPSRTGNIANCPTSPRTGVLQTVNYRPENDTTTCGNVFLSREALVHNFVVLRPKNTFWTPSRTGNIANCPTSPRTGVLQTVNYRPENDTTTRGNAFLSTEALVNTSVLVKYDFCKERGIHSSVLTPLRKNNGDLKMFHPSFATNSPPRLRHQTKTTLLRT